MAASTTNLHLLDSKAARELDLASELFHRINRVIPADQVVLSVLPNCLARDAIELMRKHGYSQVPVVQNNLVLGVFSYRSFAQKAAKAELDVWTKHKCAPGDLPVDEFLEQFRFASVKDEMAGVFDAMGKDNGVLIGTPERLIGVLTPMDFLRYLDRVAGPFVLLSEIELALRTLIRICLSDEQIAEAARRCLGGAYKDKAPTALEEMTFDNYSTLVAFDEQWPLLQPVFGGTRNRASGKLKEVGVIRNALFHFKREVTVEDHETLAEYRDWLLNKMKQAEAQRKTEVRP